MTAGTIFLSYRRQDIPGYVGRLADHLEGAFNQPVFRDVDSIGGGSDWRTALNQAISSAQIVLAIIGVRWQDILEANLVEDTDYIVFELNLARLLGKPVVPIILQGTDFDSSRNMESLNWIKDLQFIELSDRQNRWRSDLDQLVQRIAELTGLEPVDSATVEETKVTNDTKTYQTSHGDQSPNIISKSGDVTINYGDMKNDKDQA